MKLRLSLLAVALIASLSIPHYLAPGSSLAQIPSPASGQLPKPRVPSCCGGQPVTAPREVDFPYYNLTNGWTSTLNLVSDSSTPLDFTLMVKSKLGQTLFTAETIQPRAKLAIDMGSLITELGGDPTGAFSEGSVAAQFAGTIMPLVGQITMTNPALSLVNESVLVERDPGRSDVPTVLNGVWWGLAGREGRVMVSNVSGMSQSAQVFLDFGGERHAVPTPLTFLPYETKLLDLAQLLATLNLSPAQAPEGGITIIQTGPFPSLIANGRITDAATGFSTTIDFPSPANEYVSVLHASGLPVGAPTADSPFANGGTFVPHVIVRNLSDLSEAVTITVEHPQRTAALTASSTKTSPSDSAGMSIPASAKQVESSTSAGGRTTDSTLTPVSLDEPVSVTQKQVHIYPAPPMPGDVNHHPELWGRGLGATAGTVTLASFPIGPYSSVDYSLAAAISQLPLPLPYCSVRIQYSGTPGSVQAQVTSVESRGNLVVDSHVVNEGNGWTGSGANPWHLDDNTDSFVFLTNESDKPARIGFAVTANNVDYYLSLLRLNPRETRVIDLRQLRDAHVPDLKKNFIPANATDGSVTWNRVDNVAVMGRLMVINRRAGLASSYDCCPCPCPSNYSFTTLMSVSSSSTDLSVGQQAVDTAYGDYKDCNNNDYWFQCSVSGMWTAGDQTVATVDANGNVTGVAGGSTYIQAVYTDCAGWSGQSSSCYCTDNEQGTGTTNVNVVSVSQPTGPGYIPLVNTGSSGPNTGNYSATGTPAGGTYSWTTSSSKVSLSNASTSTLTVTTVTASATQNDVPITVTYTLNGRTATQNFSITVSKPTSLSVSMDSTNSTGHSCVTGSGTGTCSQSYFSGSSNYSTYLRSRQYEIMDQFGTWIAGYNLTIQESFSSPTGTCSGNLVITGNGNGDTIPDCFYFCCATCQSGGSCSISSTQTAVVNGFTVATNTINWTCTGATVNGS